MKTPQIKMDNAAAAMLMTSLRHAARVSCCPMCAEPRQEIAEGIWCPRCFDLEPKKPTTERKD